MAVTLGKRKRRSDVDHENQKSPDANGSDSENGRMRAIFKKAFEAKFAPLVEDETKEAQPVEPVIEDEEEEEESDWSGFSEDGEDEVEVVEHSGTSRDRGDLMRKAELKKFMSSKPPRLDSTPTPTAKQRKKASDSDEDTETVNLKKDKELQQLLRESHLLDGSASSSLNPTGKNRHKAIDLRLQALGSKSSVFKEEKMPMSHRKGIESKAKSMEERRRQQAKENGIILERPQMKKSKDGVKKRDRGIGGPAVGKFRSGTLTLSKNDLRDIVGKRGGGKRKGKRR